jgi:DNA-binding XRE family transcriptional regulator
MKDWKNFKKQLLANPAVKDKYDKLEPEYQLARSLLKARIAKKLTQAELAKKAGVSQVIIARLESGTSNPTIETVTKVASVLDKEIKLIGSRR